MQITDKSEAQILCQLDDTIEKLARKAHRSYPIIPVDDYKQEGLAKILRVIRAGNFDSARGLASFKTYAYAAVLNHFKSMMKKSRSRLSSLVFVPDVSELVRYTRVYADDHWTKDTLLKLTSCVSPLAASLLSIRISSTQYVTLSEVGRLTGQSIHAVTQAEKELRENLQRLTQEVYKRVGQRRSANRKGLIMPRTKDGGITQDQFIVNMLGPTDSHMYTEDQLHSALAQNYPGTKGGAVGAVMREARRANVLKKVALETGQFAYHFTEPFTMPKAEPLKYWWAAIDGGVVKLTTGAVRKHLKDTELPATQLQVMPFDQSAGWGLASDYDLAPKARHTRMSRANTPPPPPPPLPTA